MNRVVLVVVVLVVGCDVWWRWRRGSSRQRGLMLLCERAGLSFAPMDVSPDTAWLPFPVFGHPAHGTENVVWDPVRGPSIRAFDWYVDEGGTARCRRAAG